MPCISCSCEDNLNSVEILDYAANNGKCYNER